MGPPNEVGSPVQLLCNGKFNEGRYGMGSVGPGVKTVLIKILLVYLVVCIFFKLEGLISNFGFERFLNKLSISAIFLLLISFVLIWLDGEKLAFYGLTLESLGKSLLYIVGCVFLLLPAFYYSYARYCTPVVELFHSLFSFGGDFCVGFNINRLVSAKVLLNKQVIYFFISQVFFVALPEELFFRGYLQSQLLKIMRPMGAIVVGSVLFAVLHLVPTRNFLVLLTFFPGVLFGIIRYTTKSIFASVILHASFNTSVFCCLLS